MAKATVWACTDAHSRKRGEQIGLDTLVVHAVNDRYQVSGEKPPVPESGEGRRQVVHGCRQLVS